MKLVSVIIPTHNRPKSLKRAVASVQNQTYKNIEIIIVNDGSQSIDPNIQKLGSCSTITIQNNRTKGACGARNSGLNIAKGNYIAFLDDDDKYLQNCIELLVNKIEKTNSAMVYSGKNIISKNRLNYTYNYPKIFPSNWAILLNNFIGSTSSVLFNRNWKKSPNWFDESLTVLQDYDLFIEVSKTKSVYGVNKPLINYFAGESNQISIGTRGYWKSAFTILAKRSFGVKWFFQLLGLVNIYLIKVIKSNSVLRKIFNPLINVVRKSRQK